ncbi:hypothetical protein ACVW00_000369 [Marmoricola sp. URHA0025 HA25]
MSVCRLSLGSRLVDLDVAGGRPRGRLGLRPGLVDVDVVRRCAGGWLAARPAGERHADSRHRAEQTEDEHSARRRAESRRHGQHTTTMWNAVLIPAPAASRMVTKNALALPDRSVTPAIAPPAPPTPASPWVTTGVQNETLIPKSTA